MADRPGTLSAAEREELIPLMAEVARVSAGLWQELIRDRGTGRRVTLAQLGQLRGCLDQAGGLLAQPAGSP